MPRTHEEVFTFRKGTTTRRFKTEDAAHAAMEKVFIRERGYNCGDVYQLQDGMWTWELCCIDEEWEKNPD